MLSSMKFRQRNWKLFVGGAVLLVGSHGLLVAWRDAGYGGPHHDEVIALMASNARERDYDLIKRDSAYPIGSIVPAEEWHRWTSFQKLVPFGQIAKDVLQNDAHPPLYFWMLNRWLSIFEAGAYNEARWLSWFQMLVASGLLGLAVFRITGSGAVALMSVAVFLFGNSAVFTAAWVRQYSLLACFYSALICCTMEFSRASRQPRTRLLWGVLIGMITLGGMLTQYAFLTMSLPIHLAVLWVAYKRAGWRGVGIQAAVYAGAATLFLLLLPGVLTQVTTLSRRDESVNRIEPRSHWPQAAGGVVEMIIPVPAFIPQAAKSVSGAIFFVLLLGWFGCLMVVEIRSSSPGKVVIVPLAGVLGAGMLHFLLVGLGYFPGHAAGPNHTSALWLLTVLAGGVTLARLSQKQQIIGSTVVLASLVGTQLAFVWRSHRILPFLNTSYASKLKPDLVILDNLSRGYVLQVTDVLDPAQKVLVAADLATPFGNQRLRAYRSILYLPMEDSVLSKKPSVVSAASRAGWRPEELPVVHRGMHEAVLFQKQPAVE